ncbi:PHB depolymerase family esterase [uncultured Tateyamaria sp.]|uniref:alpha/beta hydrolase family esterase n=1 Tax=uncultured Tateyamaria sp. TaxID=455651 RepID=UPI002629B023|nr:PHB depolymerase family esterase [uncultured Tateyamaria sp.]
MRYIIALFALFALPAVAQSACGADAPCEIDGGSYHMLVPENAQENMPALVFYHGHNATGGMIFRGGIRSEFAGAGYVVIAPNGTPIQGRRTLRWAGREGGTRDDVAFTLDVIADARTKASIDPERIYVAGFSAGGSMAWLMACKAADEFAAFVSISGALRQPNDTADCPSGPVKFLQIHGFGDNQVPFEGRAIRDWHQGSLWDSLALARRANQCRSHPDTIAIGAQFRCRDWNDSCEAGAIRFCEHDGGHGMPRGWTTLARDWFEGR